MRDRTEDHPPCLACGNYHAFTSHCPSEEWPEVRGPVEYDPRLVRRLPPGVGKWLLGILAMFNPAFGPKPKKRGRRPKVAP